MQSKYNFYQNVSNEIDLEMLNKSKSNRKTSSNSNLSNQNIPSVNKSYSFDNYNLTICTDESTEIYLKIINKSTYQNYETIIKELEFDKSPIQLNKLIKIIYNCFESKPNHSFTYKFVDSKMLIDFCVCFDGLYKFNQSIELAEKELIEKELYQDKISFSKINKLTELDKKELNQDKQTITKISELETSIKYLETTIHELKTTIHELKTNNHQLIQEEIYFGYDSEYYRNLIKIKLNTEEIDFRTWTTPRYKFYGNIWELNKLKFLKKIIIYDDQFSYNYQPVKLNSDFNINHEYFWANTDIGKVAIHLNHTSNLSNMFDNPQTYLPNVTELVIYKKSDVKFNKMRLRSLPNLNKVSFKHYENTQLETFDFIKSNNIKNVFYINCLNIVELELIKNYFQTNNYTLNISNK